MALPSNIIPTIFKQLASEKRSSLFVLQVSDEEKVKSRRHLESILQPLWLVQVSKLLHFASKHNSIHSAETV
jgi:hypothetical protein